MVTIQYGVIYARYSSSGQRDESIEGQLRDCHIYAKQHDITIIEEYCDRAMTGTSDRRPEFQRMIRDSARKQFQAVICWKNDRFARSRYDSAIYKARLKQNGVTLLYAKETIPEGPEGIILESIMEGFAEYYSANLSQNVKRGNYDSALQRRALGKIPYGYVRGADGRYKTDPDRAVIVRRIFSEYVSGKTAKEILRDLNNDGYRMVTGNPFSYNAVNRILHNIKYTGVYRYADILDEEGIPAIVDRETYNKAQKLLDKHKHAPAQKKGEGGFLLTGKLFCGECGTAMTADEGTGKSGRVYKYYVCNKRRKKKCGLPRVPKDRIEDAVVQALADVVTDDKMIEIIADRFLAWQSKQEHHEPVELERKLKEISAAIGNIVSAVEMGMNAAALMDRMKALEEEKAALEEGIARAKIKDPELSRADLTGFLRFFRDVDTSDPGWRSYLVDTFLRTAFIFADGRLVLDLNFSGQEGHISLQLAKDALTSGEVCSSLPSEGVPNHHNLNTIVFYAGYFLVFKRGAVS